MKRVLIVTYAFPPRPTIGSVRLEGLATWLPAFGWEPVALTPSLPGDPDPRFHVVQTGHRPRTVIAEQRLGRHARLLALVKRILTDESGTWRPQVRRLITILGEVLSYPDGSKGWHAEAVRTGTDLLHRQEFQAILSSSGPATTHLVARDLKSRSGLPWLADLRDPWTLDPYYPYTPLRRRFEQRLERHTLRQADTLSITSPQWARDMSALHAPVPVHTILNGFSPNPRPELPREKDFTLIHTGKLYEGRRDPAPFLAALADLFEHRFLDRARVRVTFYGRKEMWLEQRINCYGLQDVVSQPGLIPREESLRRQRQAHVLLLFNWDDQRNEGMCPAKLYEYFAVHRPVLSVGTPRGVVTEILEHTHAGPCPRTPAEIAAVLRDWYAQYLRTGDVAFPGRPDALEHYTHKAMAGRFAALLEEIAA